MAVHRRSLTEIQENVDPLAVLDKKKSILGQIEMETTQARMFADLLVGSSIGHAVEQGRLRSEHPASSEQAKARGFDAASLKASALASAVIERELGSELKALEQRSEWLATDQVQGAFPRQPIHWPLVFPEVFEDDLGKRPNGPGFDAIIGNPPFLGGQKLTGALGVAYREYLVNAIGQGARGSADLVAYFAIRAHDLLNGSGQTGLIATNTLAQGDTREVGLDQITASGVTIRQAVKSAPWPSSSATLEYCAVWTSRVKPSPEAKRTLDGVAVGGITSSLDSESRVAGKPYRLAGNAGMAFQGSNVLGLGFTMEPELAGAMIRSDERNREVLFPYLNGEDVNARPDCSASRWVINFHGWDHDRAASYPEPYERVLRLVKPERDRNKYSKHARERWWLYERSRPELYEAIAGLERVIVITLVSKVVMPVMVPTGQVFSHALGVFATDDTAMLALLSSAPHYWWARARASSMKADLRYTPSDVFETLPLPELTDEMRELGDRLDTFRRELMLSRQAGLTTTYNMVNDPRNTDDDIVELRRIHMAIDEAVCRAYGWEDLIPKLDHGHHPVARETRFTVGPYAQRELVDRLLELNHQRYEEEVAQGLHEKPGKKKAARPKKQNSPSVEEPSDGLW